MNNLIVTSSPHMKNSETTTGIMADVVIALIPALAAGTVLFGPRSLFVCGVCILAALISELAFCLIVKKPITLKDFSAVVTGLLLGLNLPPSIPLYIAALGSVIAIVVVKCMFGGLGYNFANPAITARIVLMVSFPGMMTSWTSPFMWYNKVDAVTTATPLSGEGSKDLFLMFLGNRPGCIGETCTLLLLVGGIYLLVRRVISPIIPATFIGTVGLLTFLFGLSGGVTSAFYETLAAVMSGGLMLGAIFMATDYVTSPTFPLGKLIFGVGCGVITFVIRRFGSLPEGVSFAILIMNIIVPHINSLTAPKPFGWRLQRNETE